MIFIDNKYSQWYYNIINNAKVREITKKYTENHHIIPKSLGGSNKKENIVSLTAREHFICHWLLTKMMININHQYKMLFALNAMRMNGYKEFITSHTYEKIKIQLSNIQKKRMSGTGNSMYGKTHSEKAKQNISKKLKGLLVGDKNGMYGKTMSNETKQKISKKNKGKKLTQEHKDKCSRKLKGLLVGDKNGMYGKTHTKEAKLSMSKKEEE